jgi:hypothetical protein
MIFLLSFAYLLAGPELLNTFLNKTTPGKIIREKTQLGCISNPNPIFTSDITDIESIKLVVPPGSIVKSGTDKILKTHAFIAVDKKVPVYAPIDSKLTEGSAYIEEGITQYLLFFEASCEVTYKFDHIHEPVDKVRVLFTNQASSDSRTNKLDNIEFKTGELIGYTSGTVVAGTWDFGVYNTTVKNDLSSLKDVKLLDSHYTADCPFDYFSPQKRYAYQNLYGNNKTEEPIPTLYCN